jgi:transcriptional regulator with XRE-family HTH domain
MSRRKKRILKTMKDMDISMEQLSEYVGVSPQKLSAWINGEIDIPYSYQWKACDLLNIDEVDLLSM